MCVRVCVFFFWLTVLGLIGSILSVFTLLYLLVNAVSGIFLRIFNAVAFVHPPLEVISHLKGSRVPSKEFLYRKKFGPLKSLVWGFPTVELRSPEALDPQGVILNQILLLIYRNINFIYYFAKGVNYIRIRQSRIYSYTLS